MVGGEGGLPQPRARAFGASEPHLKCDLRELPIGLSGRRPSRLMQCNVRVGQDMVGQDGAMCVVNDYAGACEEGWAARVHGLGV